MKFLKANLKKYKYHYLIIFLILLTLFGVFSLNRYAIDTYFFESFGMKYNAINPYFHDGRLFMTGFLYLMDFFKFSYATEKILSWVLALGSLFLSAIIMFNLLNKNSKNKMINILLSVCLVANPFIIEFFMFPEYSGIMCLSVLFIFISIASIINFWENKSKSLILIAIIAAIFSVLCYQGALSMLFIIPLIFAFKDCDNFKNFVQRVIITGVIFIIAAGTIAIITKLLGATRLANHINLLGSIKSLIKGIRLLLTSTYKILPSYMLIGAFCISLVFCLIGVKKKFNFIIFLILAMISLLAVPALPHLFTSYIWMVPRSNIGYGILGVFPILFYLLYGQDKKYINYIFIGIMSILLIFQWHSGLSFAQSQIENNELNTQEAQNINKYIQDNKEYNVYKLKTYSDKNPTYTYYSLKTAGDMNVRAFGYEWAYRAALNTKSSISFEEGDTNKEYEKYCSHKNWDSFDTEQLKIINDTIYICIY